MEAWTIKNNDGKYITDFDLDYAKCFWNKDLMNAKFGTLESIEHFIELFGLEDCKPVKVEIKECGKKKRIETMVDLFAHLITRNDDRPFNKVWEMYFGNMNLEHKNMEEVEAWLNEEVEEDEPR